MNHQHTDPVGGRLRPSFVGRLLRRLTFLLGFAAFASAASAQTGTINGRVVNQATGDYLRYAQVQVVGSERSTFTEADGRFTLPNVPAGEVRLSVTYTGLDTQEAVVTVPAGGAATRDFNLTSASYDTIKLGEFVVSSAREGNAKAIVEQRQALNLKTVIAADAFGDVSEGNVGEFLRLLPGVTVDYVDNDVRTTRIRGLPAKYTTVTIDGHAVATAGSAAINTGRQFELEQVSMTSLDTVENAKTPTPDMASAGLAGNTNAISKSAFNQKGRSIKYQANVTMNSWFNPIEKSKGWNDEDHYKFFPGGQVEFVDTFLDGKLGVVLSAAHSGSFSEQRAVTTGTVFDRNPYNNGSEVPLTTQIQIQDGPKPSWRDSVLLNLEYKVSDDLKVALRTSYGHYNAIFHNRNWTLNATTTSILTTTGSTTSAAGAWPEAQNGEFNPALLRAGNTISATAANYVSPNASNTNNYAGITGSNFRKSGGTFVTSPAVSWKFDDFQIDLTGSYSQAKSAYTSGDEGFFSQVEANMPGVAWQYNKEGDRDYHIRQTSQGAANTGSLFELANYTMNGRALMETRRGKNQIWTSNLDVSYDRPEWAVPTKFKAGLASSLNVFDIQNTQPRWAVALTSGPTSATAINLADYRDPLFAGTEAGFTLTDINGVTAKAPSIDKWALLRTWQTSGNLDPYSTAANGAFNADEAANLRFALQNQFDIKETQQAAYMMATVQPTSKFSIVGGLRFEKTETQGRSFDDIGRVRTAALVGTTNTNDLNYIYARYGGRLTRKKEYDQVLPSVQGRYAVQRNLVARAAYYKSLLRPDFQNVVGGVTASENDSDSTNITFTVRNTELKPETADNFDTSLEYYFEPVGVVSVTGFYKTIKDIQVSYNSSNLADADPAILADIEEAGYPIAALNSVSRVNSTINGPKTSIWGVELAYRQELTFLPSFLNGLGVDANFTYIEPKEERLWAMVPAAGDGLSKKAFNFIVRYKYRKFSSQVTTTWVDKKINGISGLSINRANEFVPGTGTGSNTFTWIRDRWQVNVNMSYEIHRWATVFLNLNNVLNEPQYRYVEQEYYTNRHGQYGVAITAGVKGTF